MAMVAIVTQLKTVCDVTKITQQSNNPNKNPTIKQFQTIGCARLKIMPPTNNFEPQPFKMVEDMGLKSIASRST
jgi:hypothetical protein